MGNRNRGLHGTESIVSSTARTFIRTLELPYENLRTVYEGDSEVRLYRNELTNELQVGKRIDVLGIESSVAVQEGALLRQIDHPHVTPVYDVARVTGYPQPMKVVEVIMPYYRRGSLYDAFMRGERFSVGQAVRSMVGALHGVAELHEGHRILHRDLKSPNLLVADDGRLIVGDLGVAAPLDDDGIADALPNARLYSPPEGLLTGKLDRRSDLYQAGVVLHELCCGPLPYDDDEYQIDALAARLAKGRRGPLPRHLRLCPWVPARLRTVIRKATASSPAARYPRAKAMVDALTAVRLVDWVHIADLADQKRWEGVTPQRPNRAFAVEARRISARGKRSEGWRLTGLQRVGGWRRVTPDTLVSNLHDGQATAFFDSMVNTATSH
jgi:serine/threonine protein kinase